MMGAWVKQRWRKHLRTYQVRSCRASCRGGRVWSRTADSFLAAPHALAKSLPLTLSALQSGTISWQHALVMVDETATLDSAAPPPWSATSWIRTRRNRPLPPRSGTCPPTRPQRPGTASPLLHGDCRDRQKPGRSPSCARTSAATGSSAACLQPPAGSGPFRRQWHASSPPMAPAPSTGCWWTRGTGLHWKSAAPATGSPRPCGPLDNEADHILAWGNGGTTGVSNLGQPCPKHHRLRHTSRWKPTPPTKNEPPGWTSPSGRHYRGRAPGLGTTPLATPIKASHQRLGAGDWQRAGGSWTYTAAGSSSPAVSTSAISAGRGTKRTNMALKPGVLDSRATFSLWTRALASGKYAAAQPLAVG